MSRVRIINDKLSDGGREEMTGRQKRNYVVRRDRVQVASAQGVGSDRHRAPVSVQTAFPQRRLRTSGAGTLTFGQACPSFKIQSAVGPNEHVGAKNRYIRSALIVGS